MTLLRFILTLLLTIPSMAQNVLPDAPASQFATKVRPVVRVRDPIRDWKFWTGTGVLVGAMLYDQQQTLDGLKHTGCVEANGDNPRPTRGDLTRRNLPFIAGITGLKYLMARYAHVSWWSYSVGDGVGAAVHIHAGMEWNSCR